MHAFSYVLKSLMWKINVNYYAFILSMFDQISTVSYLILVYTHLYILVIEINERYIKKKIRMVGLK